MNRRRTATTLLLLLVLALGAGIVAIPGGPNLRLGPLHRAFDLRLGLDLFGGSRLTYEADVATVPPSARAAALAGVRDVIERRVNAFGVSEPVVRTQRSGDTWRVSVELAGIKDIQEAIKIIGETPLLEFLEQTSDTDTNQSGFLRTDLTGTDLTRAAVEFDTQTGQPQVSLQFNADGAKKFAAITKRNIGKPVAIFLDGSPISVPTVQSEITDGRAIITGTFTVAEAKLLAQRLNSGALPVPIHLVAQGTVGPTLGAASVAESAFAGLLGLLLVAAFMVAFYRLPGLVAVVALLLYAVLVLAIFKLIPVTLTLAGIAGFVLSIGVAVDANVLIFERTREEIRRGRSVADAVEEGFRRAWLSIRDSNASTLITAGILAWFGSSIVQGFAITLAIGVLISMFSAITVTRTLLRAVLGTWVERRPGWLGAKPPQGGKPVEPTPVRFMERRGWLFGFSLAVLVPGAIALTLWGLKFGIDFTGGAELHVQILSAPAAAAVAEASSSARGAAATVQPLGNSEYAIQLPDTPNETKDAVLAALRAKFGETIERSFDTVGPSLGSELKRRSLSALAVVLVAIVLYISWAFRRVSRGPVPAWVYGTSAVIALVHDVLIVVGIFAILGHVFGIEVDALFVTALLTVLGFSVHDTIVVFDRIRERLSITGSQPFTLTVNESITQTLVRSINTSLTTLLVLLAMLVFGGSTIRNFVLALTIGIASGTYSSVFVASPLLVVYDNWKSRRRSR